MALPTDTARATMTGDGSHAFVFFGFYRGMKVPIYSHMPGWFELGEDIRNDMISEKDVPTWKYNNKKSA